MKTLKLQGVIAEESEIRNILDSFFYENKVNIVKTADAKRVSDNAFDIVVRYTGELKIPF